MNYGVYVHIPFCVRKCNYCDFVSFPVPSGEVISAYLDALEIEFRLNSEGIGQRRGEIQSLYIGGGTPTCLDPAQLVRLMRICQVAIYRILPGKDIEVTVEANPGTLTLEKLRILKAGGVNRISLGVQSFCRQHLEKMGRIHSPQEAVEAVEMIRQAGISNVGIDLIYGLPGQTLAEWRDTLERALSLKPTHLSAYGLKIEPGTAWGAAYATGALTIPDEDLAADMYEFACQALSQAGYDQYEISNFALPECQSQHNRLYWRNQEYLGVGLNATSFINHCRYSNTGNLEDYLRELWGGRLPKVVSEDLTPDQEMAETVILGLRLLEGVDSDAFLHRFGKDIKEVYGRQIEKLIGLQLLEWEDDHLCLTGQALLLANLVFIEFV
ncbi:MAG: radical SAM family heme chaperone HemW [Bacillota bacterium]